MKKVLFFTAAAMTLSACVMETATPVAGDMETITFEAEASAQTKTTVVDGTKVYWCAGDQISVMGAAAPFTNALEEGETAAKTAFTGEVATADTYYAVYPAAGVTWNGTVATTSLVTTQLPVKGTFANGYNVTVAKTTSQEKAFPFQNVLGHVKFSVKNTVLRSVIVTANGGEIISGSFTVDAASNNPKLVPGTGRSYVQFTEFNVRNISDGEYYIALLPGTYSEGLTFEFENKEGVIATATIDGPVTLEAGHVNNIGSVDGLTWGQKESGNVIWTGKYFVEAWKGCQDLAWGGYDWSKAKAGDILKVYGGPESEGLGWWCICLKTADKDWTILPGTEQYNNPTDFSVTLTQDMIDALVANNGLVLQGQDYVFTKIELVPGTEIKYPVADDKHILIESQDMVEQAWDTQFFIQFGDAFEEGDEWEIVMNVKADKPVTIGTQTQAGLGGYLHWQCVGSVPFTTEWTTYAASGKASKEMVKGDVIAFSLNTLEEANKYYFDNVSFKVNGVEQIVNGTLDDPDELGNFWMQQYGKHNGGIVPASLAGHEPTGGDGGYALTMTNDKEGNNWSVQVWYQLDKPLKSSVKYVFKCMAKATAQYDWCSVFLQSTTAEDQNYNHGMGFTTEWKSTTMTITPDKDVYDKLTFNLGDFIGTLYLDNVSLKEEDSDVELIVNGDFETGETTGWNSWSGVEKIGEGYAE